MSLPLRHQSRAPKAHFWYRVLTLTKYYTHANYAYAVRSRAISHSKSAYTGSAKTELSVEHDPDHEDVDHGDVEHPVLLHIPWQLVVPYQPAGEQHEQKLQLLMLEDEQPRLAVAEAARELAVVVAPEDEEDLL